MKKLWNNVYTPDLVGANKKTCKYRNLGACVTDIHNKLEELRDKFEPFVKSTIKAEVTASKQAVKI